MTRTRTGAWVALAALALALTAAAPALAQKGSKVSRVRLGSAADAAPALLGPSFFLQGNGAPLAGAFQAHVDQVAAAPLDVVVLAASFPSSGSQTPECDRLIVLRNVSSCETITITAARYAGDAGAAAAVDSAEIVYFAGGNQCNYIGWQGSAVHSAVKGVVARGGGVGGGSAGLAIQGDYAYDGCAGSATSAEALANPYDRGISFSYDYFDWPSLGAVITDSHFVARDRMGRLMAFVCRQLAEGRAPAVYGLGVEEDSAVLIDRAGRGVVYGDVAYVVLGDHAPERCVSRKPVTFSNFKIWRLDAGASFDFAARPQAGFYTRSVADGLITGGSPYSP